MTKLQKSMWRLNIGICFMSYQIAVELTNKSEKISENTGTKSERK